MVRQKVNTIWEYRGRVLAGLFLASMLVLGLLSMRGDSAIVDEVAHIPSGYSYLHYQDYRLNPEHPPLIKDLAAIPLQFLPVVFPLNIPAWTTDANGQWETGWHFLFHDGNNADQILFWARVPILLLAVFFGWMIYRFCKKHWGPRAAVLATFLYAFEPNIMAHSRLVTTDLGIAAFGFFALAGFVRWLKEPKPKNFFIAAGLFAAAQLAKFSGVLLIPFFGLIALIWIFTAEEPKKFWQRFWRYGLGLVGIFAVGFALIWAFYVPQTLHMPDAVQDHLITVSLPDGFQKALVPSLTKYNNLPGAKPLVQYTLGVLMVFNRVSGGNTTYFRGQVTNQSFKDYFPVTYAIKTPIPLLILVGLSLLSGVWLYLRRKPLHVWQKFRDYSRDHVIELTFFGFVLFYAAYSINGNLNLGIRHLMPIIPLIIVLVARQTVRLFDYLKTRLPRTLVIAGFAGLLLWYLVENIMIFPHYVAYFNELIGGPGNAYKYVTDSSVDWGQDLKRLKTYVDSNPDIDKISVDYFGGGEPKYYFCSRKFDAAGALIKDSTGYDCTKSKYVEWHAQNGVPKTRYIAVSETFLMNDLYYAPKRGDMGYTYLREKTPIAKIGYSIYVYKL